MEAGPGPTRYGPARDGGGTGGRKDPRRADPEDAVRAHALRADSAAAGERTRLMRQAVQIRLVGDRTDRSQYGGARSVGPGGARGGAPESDPDPSWCGVR
jgi:hypothetical protein